MQALKKYFILLLFLLPDKPETQSKIANEKSKLDNELALRVKKDPAIIKEQSGKQLESNLERIKFLKKICEGYLEEAKIIWKEWVDFVVETSKVYGKIAPLGFRLQLIKSLQTTVNDKKVVILNPKKYVLEMLIVKRDMLKAYSDVFTEALEKNTIQETILYLLKNVIPMEGVWEFTHFKIPNPLKVLTANSEIAHLNEKFAAKSSITKTLALIDDITLGEVNNDGFKATLNPFKEMALTIDAEKYKNSTEVGSYINELKSAITAEKAKIEEEMRNIDIIIQQEDAKFSNFITELTNELLNPEA